MAAGQGWSVIIQGDPMSFDPDVYGTDPGAPLKAQVGDMVCWNNQTEEPHQIAVADKDGTTSFTTELIESRKSSQPGYVAQATDLIDVQINIETGAVTGTIRYSCVKHDGEVGTIQVVTS